MATDDALVMVYDRYFNAAYWRGEVAAIDPKDIGACDCIMIIWSQCNFKPPNMARAVVRLRQQYGASYLARQCLTHLERNCATVPLMNRAALLVTLSSDKEIRMAFVKSGVYLAVVRKAWTIIRRKGAASDVPHDTAHAIAQ